MSSFELIMPGGSLDKIKIAIEYGADAVYGGLHGLNLRVGADNLSYGELRSALDFVHARGKRLYLTLNSFPREEHLPLLMDTLEKLKNYDPDGVIVADAGVLAAVREKLPNMEIHLSTQANTVNSLAVNFWKKAGVSRVILARELSLSDIAQIKGASNMPLEGFVHGAMCVAFSGRCMLSAYFTGRNANLGDCAQSCRWTYNLVEEKRPGEYLPICEDESGTRILSSRDMCLLEHLDKMSSAGITGFKVEGRMKSEYYVAVVARTYRAALDALKQNPSDYQAHPKWKTELDRIKHRPYCTGFYFDSPMKRAQMALTPDPSGVWDFIGIVREFLNDGTALVEVRNQVKIGETMEWIGPKFADDFTAPITKIFDRENNPAPLAQPNAVVRMETPHPVRPNWILRRPPKHP